MKYLDDNMDDKWILIVGIPFVGIVLPFIFSGFSLDFLHNEGFRKLLLSVISTMAIWLGIRKIVVILWNKYPWELHPYKHLVYEIVLVSAYTILVVYLGYMITFHTSFVDASPYMPMHQSIISTLLITFLITSLHEAWFFYTQWNISLVKAQALEKENIQSQYQTLKSQINPHFLFNTLNTLSSLIEDDPPKAVNYVEKTADFMRSLLDMKDKEIISLRQETAIIETFYMLQKARFGDNLQLTIELPLEVFHKQLPPLALQMLLENAIKHNIISSEKPLNIRIFLSDHNYLTIINNLQKKEQKAAGSGIGLQNIKNRYGFLTDQPVIISETHHEFSVKLPLLKSTS